MNKYKFYCDTEGQWITTGWLENEPTECPNGAGHVINVDSFRIIALSSDRDILLSIGGNSGEYYYECDSGYWEVIRKFQFRGTNSLGQIKSCSIIANVDFSAYPGTYRLYDVTNDTVLTTWTIDSESFESFENYDITNGPKEQAVFEIHGKSGDVYGTGRYTKITTFFMEFV